MGAFYFCTLCRQRLTVLLFLRLSQTSLVGVIWFHVFCRFLFRLYCRLKFQSESIYFRNRFAPWYWPIFRPFPRAIEIYLRYTVLHFTVFIFQKTSPGMWSGTNLVTVLPSVRCKIFSGHDLSERSTHIFFALGVNPLALKVQQLLWNAPITSAGLNDVDDRAKPLC